MANHFPVRPKPAITSSAMNTMPYLSQISRTPAMYPGGGTMMPAVPGTDSRMIAANDVAPSCWMSRSRYSSARSLSCCSFSAWNDERYRNGPLKCTTPLLA